MDEQKSWKWVWHQGQHHLARRTCQGTWVAICHAVSCWPFSATPERIDLTNGATVWALRQKVQELRPWGSNVRVSLLRRERCLECHEHVRAIKRLWPEPKKGGA